MIWLVLLVGAGLIVWFMLAPRRFQKFENIPEYVTRNLDANPIVETTEDPREVRPIAQRAASRAGDIPMPGHGDSLTRDWPTNEREPHGRVEQTNPPPQG